MNNSRTKIDGKFPGVAGGSALGSLQGGNATRFEFDLLINTNITNNSTDRRLQFEIGTGSYRSSGTTRFPDMEFAHADGDPADQFFVRNIEGTPEVSSTLVGLQRIGIVTNNSGGSAINYIAPDGSNPSVADQTLDVYAGNTLLLDDTVSESD